MIWHDYEVMKPISALVAAGKNAVNQDFRNFWHSEQFAPFPRGR